MAERHEFDSYDDYIEAQIRLTRRKLAKPNARCFTTVGTVRTIAGHYSGLDSSPQSVRGLCHGVRRGEEVKLFGRWIPGAWIGTEITPELCDGVVIVHEDFSIPRPEWLGQFDVIYSNSLDHSPEPRMTVRAWLSCLSPRGRLYVEWTPWHARLGRNGWTADCFAAGEEEYAKLLDSAGRLETRLSVTGEPRTIFVAK